MSKREDETFGTCEDPRLKCAGYYVCGSHGDTQWHWHCDNKVWRDGYKTESAAVNAALRHLADTTNLITNPPALSE
jgi:hypothetical protein